MNSSVSFDPFGGTPPAPPAGVPSAPPMSAPPAPPVGVPSAPPMSAPLAPSTSGPNMPPPAPSTGAEVPSIPDLPPVRLVLSGGRYYWVVGGDCYRGWDGISWVPLSSV